MHPLEKVWHWLKRKLNEPNLTDNLIVLLTGGVVYWAGEQSREMQDAGRQTDRTITILELQQRPFVGPHYVCLAPAKEFSLKRLLWVRCELPNPKVFDVISPGEEIKSKVVVSNTGHSPAYNAQLIAHWCLSPKAVDHPPAFEVGI